MKQKKSRYALLAMMLLAVLTGCNKDGDETITLERGSAMKIIPGRWHIGTTKGTPPISGWRSGTIVTFTPGGSNGGTFATLPDGPKGNWSFPEGEDVPRIKIGGTDFGLTAGKGIMSCHYPYGSSTHTWEGTFEKDSDSPDGSGSSSGTENPSGVSDIDKLLVGKWIQKKKEWPLDQGDNQTFNDNTRWMELKSNHTATSSRNLFENESAGFGTWKVVTESKKNILIFNGDSESKFHIIEASSTNLTLGWIENGRDIEISYFIRAN